MRGAVNCDVGETGAGARYCRKVSVHMRVICDFDGTITRQDTTDLVLEALAHPEWQALEDRWIAGVITAAECMREQIALIDASQAELDAVLDTAVLDPGFLHFVAWCRARHVPVSIVSDGADYFISRILRRHGLLDLPIVANRLFRRDGRWHLEQPWARVGCANGSGVCKCAAAGPWGEALEMTVFVGDGRSDFCVSAKPDLLFAKSSLADYAAARGQAFIPFDTFADVTATLGAIRGDLDAGFARAASA